MAGSKVTSQEDLELSLSDKKSFNGARFFLFLGTGMTGILLLLLPLVITFEFFNYLSWDLLMELSPVVFSTVITAVLGMILSLPLALTLALGILFTPEHRLAKLTKNLLSLFTALPTVVIGYISFTLLTPGLQFLFPSKTIESFNTLSVSLGIAILITPMLCQHFLRVLRRFNADSLAALIALGVPWSNIVLQLLVPTSLRGFLAASFLGFSRAFGQTMISALAGGIGTFTRLGEGSETLGSFMVRLGSGAVDSSGQEFQLLFGAGFLLLSISLIFYSAGSWIDASLGKDNR